MGKPDVRNFRLGGALETGLWRICTDTKLETVDTDIDGLRLLRQCSTRRTEQQKLSIKLCLKKKALPKKGRNLFLEREGLPNKDFLLAQVFFCKKKKCIEVRGMFDEEEGKGFYYKRL